MYKPHLTDGATGTPGGDTRALTQYGAPEDVHLVGAACATGPLCYMTVDDSNQPSIIPPRFLAAYPSARYGFLDELDTPFEAAVLRLPLEAASALDAMSWDAPGHSVYVQILNDVPVPTLDSLEPVEACRRIAYTRQVLEWENVATAVIVPFVESVSRLAATYDVPFDLALQLAPEPCEYLTPVYNEHLLASALSIVQNT